MSVMTDPRALANLLLVEIGNSHVSLATTRDGRLSPPERLETAQRPGLADRLNEAWTKLPAQRLRAAVVASVVPEMTEQIREIVGERLGAEVLVLGEDIPIPIEIDMSRPESAGVD